MKKLNYAGLFWLDQIIQRKLKQISPNGGELSTDDPQYKDWLFWRDKGRLLDSEIFNRVEKL